MHKIEMELPAQGYEIEESFKTLRTNLQFCGDEIKVVNITSCSEDEGKSTVSKLLSQALVASGNEVLLIDADMRKSVFVGSLKLNQPDKIPGLSHFLSGQAKLDEVLCQVTNVPGMYFILSGTFPPNPSELLGHPRFAELINATKDVFDYVIIDTPPLGAVIDSAIVASKCDGSILVVEAGAVDCNVASDVMEQLNRTGSPVLGIVLNKVDAHQDRYYKKRYSHYYKEKTEEERK